MGSTDRILMLKLLGDTSDINQGLKGTTGRLKKLGASAKSWGRAWTKSLVLDGLSHVTDAITDGIKGFEDGEQAAKNLGATWRNLGLDGSKLGKTIESISNTALDLGFDDADTVKGYDVFIKKTRDTTKASKLMALAFDIARAENIPLAQAVKKAGQIYDGSGRAVKQYGLKGKTAMDRVAEARRIERRKAEKWAKDHPMQVLIGKIQDGFEKFGAVLKPLVDDAARFAQTHIVPIILGFRDALGNGELAAQVVLLAAGVGALALAAYAHPLLALAAAVVVLTAVTALAVKDDWLGQLASKIDGLRQQLRNGEDVDGFGEALVRLGDLADTVLGPPGRAIWSLFGGIARMVLGALTLDMDTFVGGVGESFQGLVGLVLSPFQIIWNLVKGGFGLLGIDIGAWFASLPDTILLYAADIGETAWGIGSTIAESLMNGIGDLAGRVGEVVSDIVSRVADAVRSAAIAVATAWNQLGAFGAGSVHIFDAGHFGIPGTPLYLEWGAFDLGWPAGDLIPNISLPGGGGGRNQLGVPGYRKGLWSVPHDGYPAILHRRESVLPANFAEEYRQAARTGRAPGGRDSVINLNLTVQAGPGVNGAALGQELTRYLEQYVRNGGRAHLKRVVNG